MIKIQSGNLGTQKTFFTKDETSIFPRCVLVNAYLQEMTLRSNGQCHIALDVEY